MIPIALIFRQAISIFVIFLLIKKSVYSYSQVGGEGICTNFSCRYGECEQLANSFQCHCQLGVKGFNCDRLRQAEDSVCSSSPCWNEGVCRDLGNDWRCQCKPGTYGKNCRTIQNAPCLFKNPCRNNAVCRVDNLNKVYCVCVGYWTGAYCDQAVPLCSRLNPCFNGGTCVNNACQCLRNFTGEFCQTFTRVLDDKIVKVFNKGWYVAQMFLTYPVQVGIRKEVASQTASIGLGQEFTFRIPYSVDFEYQIGTYLSVKAAAGVQVLSIQIKTTPLCIHTWGVSLITRWSFMQCW